MQTDFALSPEEWGRVEQETRRRMPRANDPRKSKFDMPGQDWETEFNGVAGECILHKFAGVPWVIAPFREPDMLGFFECKTVAHLHYTLLIQPQPHCFPERPYCLVARIGPNLWRVMGFRWGWELQEERFWDEQQKPYPAYSARLRARVLGLREQLRSPEELHGLICEAKCLVVV